MAGAHVVREFNIGNARIKFADNYCSRSAEETSWILKQIAERAQRQFVAAAAAGRYEEKQEQRTTADCS